MGTATPTGAGICSEKQVESYLHRVSGPLLDRIDMHITVPSVEYDAMRRREKPESSAVIRARVNAARAIQQKRFEGTGVSCNAYMTPPMIGQYCALDEAGEKLMRGAFERLGLTGRSHDRILLHGAHHRRPRRERADPARTPGRGDPVPQQQSAEIAVDR